MTSIILSRKILHEGINFEGYSSFDNALKKDTSEVKKSVSYISVICRSKNNVNKKGGKIAPLFGFFY